MDGGLFCPCFLHGWSYLWFTFLYRCEWPATGFVGTNLDSHSFEHFIFMILIAHDCGVLAVLSISNNSRAIDGLKFDPTREELTG